MRVLLIKHRTDSFLLKTVNRNVFGKLNANFGVTYQIGKFGRNYQFLNKEEQDPENIYALSQYYSINDRSIGLSDTIGVYYLELKNKFAPETNSLEVRFTSNDDYLKVKALNYLYNATTQERYKKLIKLKKLKDPIIIISVDGKSNTYFVLVKDKNRIHNYAL